MNEAYHYNNPYHWLKASKVTTGKESWMIKG
jgi:hypothetical protein